MEMLLLNLNPDEPYVAFVPPRELPWWAYEMRGRTPLFGRSRQVLGHALIRAGRAVAAEHRATAIG